MEGIEFVVNDKGKKTAALIDLNMYGEIWEDFYDKLLARSRRNEPRETLDEVRKKLVRQGKLNA